MIQGLFFYIFAAVLLGSAVMVIASRNPVHAVLFLILAFCNAAGLFLLCGAEFLALVTVIVYVGAVAVLFLFVVMMLDIDPAHLRVGLRRHLPLGGAVGAVLIAELILMAREWRFAEGAPLDGRAPAPDPSALTNTEALGRLIYTDYVLAFQTAGLILLVAMVGAILLTLRTRPGVRRQDISAQLARNKANSVDMVSLSGPEGQP